MLRKGDSVLLLVAGITFLHVWLASKEKPQYDKKYFQTRSDGVFKTACATGFQEYLDHVSDEVSTRFMVGPILPMVDLHIKLHHPELEENWRRELCQSRLRKWMGEGLNITFAIGTCLLIADFVTWMLTQRYGLLLHFTTENTFEKLVGLGFAIAVYHCVQRSRSSINRTQGYLDGYSDRCRGPKQGLTIFSLCSRIQEPRDK